MTWPYTRGRICLPHLKVGVSNPYFFMKEITRYTYLNLETRPDRKLLAECTAWRDGIPKDLVNFWKADDSFQTFDEIARHAVARHGFKNFKPFIGQNDPVVKGFNMCYNILCYLTDRVTREDTLEIFLHDDTYFAEMPTGKAHSFLNSLCKKLQQHGEFNMLLLNPFSIIARASKDFKEAPIFRYSDPSIGGLFYEGIRSTSDFAIVLSTKGAEYLRNMILNHHPAAYIEVLLHIGDWDDLSGVFTTVLPYVRRYPNEFVLSNANWQSIHRTP